jgi:hypothetical protein
MVADREVHSATYGHCGGGAKMALGRNKGFKDVPLHICHVC